MHSTSTVLSAGLVHPVDAENLNKVSTGELGTRVLKLINSRSSALPLWPFLALSLGFFAMALFCTFTGINSLKPAVSKRRLAGQYSDDLLLPSSPQLEELCASIGFWVPADSSPGGRKSPHFVQDFFKELDKSSEPVPKIQKREAKSEGIHMIVSAIPEGPNDTKRKLSLDSNEESDGEQPGPSGKASQGPLLVEYGAADLSAPAALPVPQQRPGASPPQQVKKQLSASGGILNERNAEPSTLSATHKGSPTAATTAQERFVHPYVRLPIVPPEVIPRPWGPLSDLELLPRHQSKHPLFVELHDLLLQPSLDSTGVRRLMNVAEGLASYALCRLTFNVTSSRASNAVRDMGRRFLLLDALHSAARAVGTGEPPWWKAVLNAAVQDFNFRSKQRRPRPGSCVGTLEKLLGAALMKYKNGSAPSDAEVIRLKRMLFCEPQAPSVFRGPEWKRWKDDDVGTSGHSP